MKKEEALEIVHNALSGYVEDCAGADSEEAQELDEAWNLLKEELEGEPTYYALYNDGFLETGLNCTSEEDVRTALLDLQEAQVDDPKDFKIMQEMSLEDLCAHLGITLYDDQEPF